MQAWRGAGNPDVPVLYGVLRDDREGAHLEPPPGIDEDELAQLVATGVHPSTDVLGGVRFERVGDWRLDVSLRPREPPERFETAFAAADGELTELLAV